MKVYFTGSPRALKTLKAEHEAVYEAIEKNGGTNLSKLMITADPDGFYERTHEEAVAHYAETINLMKKADIVVAEVSMHSMSTGFLINKALEENKCVIALYLPKHRPFFLDGVTIDRLQVLEYTEKNVVEIVQKGVEVAIGLSDVRFNFYISPEIGRYLDWVSQHKKLPRAVFLRSLLEKSMRNEKEFEK